MRLVKKAATEADEATQSINCGEQFHEVWGQCNVCKEWAKERCFEPEGPVDKCIYHTCK
jgi:hypothetical protein